MPCDGPSKEHAYKEGDKIADSVFEYLKSKHTVSKDILSMERSKKEWDEQAQKIRDAIKEMIWIDHAEF